MHEDFGSFHHLQRAGDAAFQRDLGERLFDDQACRARCGSAAVGVEFQAGHERAVAQHQFARFLVGCGRQVQCPAADDQSVEHQPATGADG